MTGQFSGRRMLFASAAIALAGASAAHAQAAQPSTQAQAPAQADAAAQPPPPVQPLPPGPVEAGASTGADSPAAVSEVVVTGTSIRGIAPVGSETFTLGREQIEQIQATTTDRLLATVPELQSFNTRPRTTSGFGGQILAPDVRGLGAGATLALINGHRIVHQGISESVSDFSGISPSAIQRIEVVPDGASSIYGSDAVAGVVNLILRRDFNGVDAQATGGYASGYQEVNTSITAGKTWTGGSFLISYQYDRNTALAGSSRDYNTSNLAPRGGADARSISTYDPNVVVNGVNYAAPSLLPGTNYLDTAKITDILPREERNSVVATFNQKINDRISFFADSEYSHRADLIRFPQNTGSFTINNTNPFFQAPPGTGATSETVNYSFGRVLSPYDYNPDTLETFNISGGFDFKIAGDWKGQVFGTYGHSDVTVIQGLGSADGNVAAAAAAGTTPDTAFDFFGDRTNPAIIAALGNTSAPALGKQDLYQAVAKADGSLFQLPGGAVKLAVGAEYRDETYDATVYNATYDGTRIPGFTLVGDGEREVYSIYGEVFIPVVSALNARPGVQELSISASGRYDHYSDFGDTENPKVGVSYAPIRGVRFKGTYGTSFRAPAQSDTNAVDTRVDVIANAVVPGVLTPNDGRPYNTLVVAGGNPQLQPETATTYSAGVELTPELVPHFHASATYFRIEYGNVIASAYPQLFSNPAFRNYYILNPTAAQVHAATDGLQFNGNSFDPYTQTQVLDLFRRFNFNSRLISGVDWNASYDTSFRDTLITAGVAGTTFIDYTTTVLGGTPTDGLETGQVRWRLRGSLDLRRGPGDLTFFLNYTGEYKNPGITPVQTVDAFTTVDLNFTYDLPALGPWKVRPQLILNVENLFDSDPPFFNSFQPAGDGTLGGFNYTLASPLGRFVQAGLRVRF